MVLVKSMGVGMRSVLCCTVLISAMSYAFGIGLMQLSRSFPDLHEQHFSTVVKSVRMLVLSVMLPDHVDFVNEVYDESKSCGAVLALGLVMMSTCGMNILVGILVQVAFNNSVALKTEMDVLYVKDRLKRSWMHQKGDDGNDRISAEQFMCMLPNRSVAHALTQFGIDVIGLLDFREHL